MTQPPPLGAARRAHHTRQVARPGYRAHTLSGRMNGLVEHLNAAGAPTLTSWNLTVSLRTGSLANALENSVQASMVREQAAKAVLRVLMFEFMTVKRVWAPCLGSEPW